MKSTPFGTWEATVPFLFQGQEVMRVTGLQAAGARCSIRSTTAAS